jgi:hypothetical protein
MLHAGVALRVSDREGVCRMVFKENSRWLFENRICIFPKKYLEV